MAGADPEAEAEGNARKPTISLLSLHSLRMNGLGGGSSSNSLSLWNCGLSGWVNRPSGAVSNHRASDGLGKMSLPIHLSCQLERT